MTQAKAAEMRAWLKKAFSGMENVIFPQELVCLSCGCFSRGALLCEECRPLLDRSRFPGGKIAPMRQAVWVHRDLPRYLVLHLKHGKTAVCAEILVDGMANQLGNREHTLPRETVVTSVPMTKKMQWERGIDHGELLAQGVADRLGLPFRPLMWRVRETRQQQGLNIQERLKNVKGAFAPIGKIDFPVLLVDDVYTTGATVNACLAALRAGGASWVMVEVANRTMLNTADDGIHITGDMTLGEPPLDGVVDEIMDG